MNKTLIGLTIGGLLGILDIFPAHSSSLSSLDTKDYAHLAEIVIDTAAEISVFQKTSKMILKITFSLTFRIAVVTTIVVKPTKAMTC